LRQTHDPAGGRKQIPLRYAGIGARYGLAWFGYNTAGGRKGRLTDRPSVAMNWKSRALGLAKTTEQ
jgi:hypothetical protein